MFQMLPILAWFGGRMPSSFGWKALGAERPTIPPLGSCSEIFLGWCPDNQREGHFGGETLGITNQLVILVFFGGNRPTNQWESSNKSSNQWYFFMLDDSHWLIDIVLIPAAWHPAGGCRLWAHMGPSQIRFHEGNATTWPGEPLAVEVLIPRIPCGFLNPPNGHAS